MDILKSKENHWFNFRITEDQFIHVYDSNFTIILNLKELKLVTYENSVIKLVDESNKEYSYHISVFGDIKAEELLKALKV